jgi:vitamin B12 transporter
MQNKRVMQGFSFLAVAIVCNLIASARGCAETVVLPEMTVSAPGYPLSDRINNPQHLGEEDITVAHERSITDVIQGFPGVAVNRVGGFGQVTALYFRGAGGQGVVSLDGLPLLQSLPGLFSLDTLPAEAIESAEITRGVDSADKPFQSLGGNIRLKTYDQQTTGGKLSVEGGSFGILRETLQAGAVGSLGRVTATVNRTDAFDGMHAANSAQNPERDPAHFTQGILRFSSNLAEKINWQGSVFYRKSNVAIDTYGLNNQRQVVEVDDINGKAHEETWLAQNTLNAHLTDNWNSQLQLGFTQMATESDLTLLQNKVFTRLYLADWRNQHTLYHNDRQDTLWQLNWGAQTRHEQGESTSSAFAQQRTMVASYIQTQGKISNISGEAGVRVEQYDQFGDQPLFKSAAAWQIRPGLTLRASGGTGFRIPSYTELLFLFFANKNLKPERSASGDLGLEWLPVKGAKINLNGFYNRYYDLITIAHEPFTGPATTNVPDASVAGMELAAQYAWSDYLEAGASYTFSESRNLHTGKALPFRPEHSARFWGQHRLAAWPLTLWAEAIVRSSTWNDFENTLPVGSSLQINAALRYALSKQVELYVRGENLSNNRTPQVFSSNVPGVAVYGGFKVTF